MTCLVGTLDSDQTFVGIGRGVLAPISVRSHFCSMIFGRVMANICHGGGSRRVAFQPFSEVVRCGVWLCFFGSDVAWRRSKNQCHFFYECHLF